MTKSKKGKVVQMLSPENYIRKKARTLPIFECLVDPNWEETRLPTVVIARKHINGNITFCTYMVDLLCLGVKDSFYEFNVSPTQYKEFKDAIAVKMGMISIEYPLAHNIILAGVEFAEEFGFKPHKQYESVTKFMLEEDTDEIELIEIECGDDGMPFYMKGPHDDDAKVKRIIAQLEKMAGPGNYDFMTDEMDDFKDHYFEDDEFEEDEFEDWTIEEKRDLFLSLSHRLGDLLEEERKRLYNLVESMTEDLVDVDRYDQFYDQYMDELDMEIDEEESSAQLLGLTPGVQPHIQDWVNRFLEIYDLIDEDPKAARQEVELFHKETNGIPGAYYLELVLLQKEKSPNYPKQLKKSAQAYPHYALLQILWASWQLLNKNNPRKIPGYPFPMNVFFAGRQSIHPIEQLMGVMLYIFMAGIEMDIDKIDAINSVVSDIDFEENEQTTLAASIILLKFNFLLTHVK